MVEALWDTLLSKLDLLIQDNNPEGNLWNASAISKLAK